jgi:hypothetical protein
VAIAELSIEQRSFPERRIAAAVRNHLLLELTPRITMNEIVKQGRIFFAIAIMALDVQHFLAGLSVGTRQLPSRKRF